MIQHHNGALIMVKDLFDTAGAGQDAEIFNFATDADNTQRAEIKIMQTMLEKKSQRRNDEPIAAVLRFVWRWPAIVLVPASGRCSRAGSSARNASQPAQRTPPGAVEEGRRRGRTIPSRRSPRRRCRRE